MMNNPDLQPSISALTYWHLDNGKLVREWTFPTFAAAISFINEIAPLAEAANHHPDIDIRYNVVRLSLITHSKGAITQRDIDFAQQLNT